MAFPSAVTDAIGMGCVLSTVLVGVESEIGTNTLDPGLADCSVAQPGEPDARPAAGGVLAPCAYHV